MLNDFAKLFRRRRIVSVRTVSVASVTYNIYTVRTIKLIVYTLLL
jgi:hypothetical protein